jgi:Acetyltransferase (GNAT) domain
VPAATSVEDYLKGLAPKQRAAIRRGDARGLRAGPSSLDEITRWFPERVSGPYQRQGVASDYSPAAARALAARLATDPRMLWRSVRDGERVLAVNACVVDGDRLWGWLLAGDPVPGPSPHVAAYWDAITWSRDRGLSCDFGGAPTSGVRDFKIAMGGELETCSVAERVRPRAYRVARALHARLASRPAGLPGG